MHAFNVQTFVLVEHESLISILEDGGVLEWHQERWDLGLIHKEASEEHEWDDKNRSQSDGKLLVREEGSDDERVASRGVIDKEQNQEEGWKLVALLCIKSD